MSLRITRQYTDILAAGDGSARVTRQYADVLGSGDGAARVTRQYVDVLGPAGASVTAEDVLALVQVASGVMTREAESVLVLSQTAEVEVIRAAFNELVLAQTAEMAGVYVRNSADALVLVEQGIGNFAKRVDAFSFLTPDHVAAVEKVKRVADTLVLLHEASGDRVLPVYHELAVTHEAQVTSVYDRPVSDVLTLGQTAAFTYEILRAADDTLNIGQAAIGDLCKVGQSALSLSHEAQVEKIKCVSHNLTLDHQAGREGIWIRRRTDALTLAHAAAGQREVSRSSTQTITLAHSAAVDLVRTVSHSLVLSHDATADKCYVSSHTLSLNHEATFTTNRAGAQSHILTLTQEAEVGFLVRHVGVHSNLAPTLKHSATYTGPHYVSASDQLAETHQNYDPVTGELTDYIIGLQDAASAALIPSQARTASHVLSFSEQAIGIVIRAGAIAATASHSLTLVDAAYSNKMPVAASMLSLADLAVVVSSKVVEDTLELEDEAQVAGVFNLAAASVLDICQYVAFTAVVACWDHKYHPFVGEGSGGPTPPPATLDGPVEGIGECRLVYPAEDRPITDTVTLKSPDFGNKDRLQFNRISRETRGGTLVVYADPIWPKVQVQVLTFSGLTQAQGQALLTFLLNHLGKEVGFVDWEGRYWTGVIVNPTDPVVQDGKDRFTASFELEGELAVWEP